MAREPSAVPFKTLKDLKRTHATPGPTAPVTLALLDGLQYETLPPYDWKAIARACCSGADHLLWKSDSDAAIP